MENKKPSIELEKYKKPSDDEIKKNLTDEQYNVTQKNRTELPFKNEYWNNKEKGIYVDVVTGIPLFVSSAKFNSGCGWTSFTKPIDKNIIVYKRDSTLGMERTEVRSKNSNSHLGHVFDDGPIEDGGLRYCINSASLKFIPLSEMKKEGYEEFIELVEWKIGCTYFVMEEDMDIKKGNNKFYIGEDEEVLVKYWVFVV